MKLFKTTICTALLCSASGAFAADIEHTGAFTIATDYVDRGVSQSDESAVIQLQNDWVGSNWYAGLASSLVDEGTEIQVKAGLQTTRNDIDYAFGLRKYIYTDHDQSDNITEVNFVVGTDYKGAYVNLNVDYSQDVGEYNDAEIEFYGADIGYSRQSTSYAGIEYHADLGFSTYDVDGDHHSITFWQIGVTKVFGENCDVSVDFYDTTEDSDISSDRFVLSTSYAF